MSTEGKEAVAPKIGSRLPFPNRPRNWRRSQGSERVVTREHVQCGKPLTLEKAIHLLSRWRVRGRVKLPSSHDLSNWEI